MAQVALFNAPSEEPFQRPVIWPSAILGPINLATCAVTAYSYSSLLEKVIEETEDVSLSDEVCFLGKPYDLRPFHEPSDVTAVVIYRLRVKH